MNHKLLVFSLILAVGLTSCGSHKNTVTYKRYNSKKYNKSVVVIPKKDLDEANEVFKQIKANVINPKPETLNYIENFAPLAMIEMRKYQIPSSITLAQGILESTSGRSELSLRSNNHFGVKCHKDWQGKRVYYDDDKKNECFRKYDHPIGSFKDHSLFLRNGDRYAFLFKLRKDDFKGWAKGLKKAGYATDPKYPKKLLTIIDNYHLFRYDDEVLHHKNTKIVKAKAKEVKPKYEGEILLNENVKTTKAKDVRIQQVKEPDSTIVAKSDIAKSDNNFDKGVNVKTVNVKRGDTIYAITIIQPVNKLTKQSAKKLAEETVRKIVEQPTKIIVNQPIEKAVKQPIKKPVEQKVKKIVEQQTKKPIKQPTKKSVKLQPVKKVVEQPVKKSIKQLDNKLVKPVKAITYKVKKGDNLYAISKKYNVEVPSLKEWNNLTSDNLLVGQEIVIKKSADQSAKKSIEKSLKKPTEQPIKEQLKQPFYNFVEQQPTEKPLIQPVKKSVEQPIKESIKQLDNKIVKPVKVVTYKVEKGDNLYAISKKYNVDILSLKEWNNLTSNELSIGQEIIIKKIVEQPTKESKKQLDNKLVKPVKAIIYKVKKGDTLYTISKKYNVEVSSLKEWNNLTSNNLLIGQEIIIKK